MMLRVDSDEYKRLFGGLGNAFESRSPPYEAITDGLMDPSIDPNNVNADFAISDGIAPRGIFYRQGVEDVQNGVRFMLRHIVSATDNTDATVIARASNGTLERYVPALEDVMKPVNLGSLSPLRPTN